MYPINVLAGLCHRSLFVLAIFLFSCISLHAQMRVTPESARGGEAQDDAWTHVPELFQEYLEQHLPPEWPIPEDINQWESKDRYLTKKMVMELLGDLPDRPENIQVTIRSTEKHDGYTLERFDFHNGVDMIVPGILLIPDNLTEPAPAIVGLHGHGSSKETIGGTHVESGQHVGPALARKGYVVAAIDAYFNDERLGLGPSGDLDDKRGQETSLFKLNLWLGRSLWGMMLRDEQILIDYLETRSEVDPHRIGATGMSMGSTRGWWLAAIDERIKAVVAVACFTRYTELIENGDLRRHGIYYFVPDMLKHFDTEAIFSLVAPRPMLHLSGDEDPGAPVRGILTLEEKVGSVYDMYGAGDQFLSVIYENTGHEYLPEMQDKMIKWFEHYLPVNDETQIDGLELRSNE